TSTRSPDVQSTSGDLSYSQLWRRRRLGCFFLRTFACFHFNLGGQHRICDGHLFADLQVSCDFCVGVTIDFPTVLPFLDGDHRVCHFQHRPGHLVSLRARGESCAAERETGCGQQTEWHFHFHVSIRLLAVASIQAL